MSAGRLQAESKGHGKCILSGFVLRKHIHSIECMCVSHLWEKPFSTLIDAILTGLAVFATEHEYSLLCRMELQSPDQA